MIAIDEARKLLDMGSRIGQGQRADEQLEGAVAIFNLLHREKVAYLADEVGMGKTYVALGAIALFRHLDPDFRLLVIAPRENIQMKWMKEMRNFVAHNVRLNDLRIKGVDGRPMRPLVDCSGLIDFVHKCTLNPDRDFFLRLSSFSLALPGGRDVDVERAKAMRNRLCEYVSWLDRSAFDLRSKVAFKENFARGVSCALPKFDLVVVDEGHNLKHGLAKDSAARNHVLSLCMGHGGGTQESEFRSRGPLARRVLFLSATPVEESYRQLWNQLDIFGRGGAYSRLLKEDASEQEKKSIAARFLIRRVTSIRVGGKELTKNLYRREWRRGGMSTHDQPIFINDVREKLTVALVQKKVSELLGHERFGSSFQIGMLASFESFLQTAKVDREDQDTSNFDDGEQTDDSVEREGVDVADVNRLAESYRRRFGRELPHPKMDAMVRALALAWARGEKALVFVRRVASVRELKRKLDEVYDQWLLDRLRRDLPSAVLPRLEGAIAAYGRERAESLAREALIPGEPLAEGAADEGGSDTFFAWFFRGAGPAGLVSGARVQQRFIERSTTLSTFFEDNLLSYLLECRPREVVDRLCATLNVSDRDLAIGLEERTRAYLSGAKRQARADQFDALQGAALEWLSELPGPHQTKARAIWRERFSSLKRPGPAARGVEGVELLKLDTFFTELRRREGLAQRLWPRPTTSDDVDAFREMELRRQLLASAARLGHAFIDMYVLVVRRLGSIEARARQSRGAGDDEVDTMDTGLVEDYLRLLESQMAVDLSEREWGAFDELAAISAHFDLIIDVNAPAAREEPLSESARKFGQLLRAQQPVGGMAGQVNKTLVAQFRMPGYPLVLFTTDLLQEGEDLHTFCSSVYHYGISWTPSSMEQRTGRVDRVRSATDRRLASLAGDPTGDELLQVYLPHLEDTVEVFQVNRVLHRMNTFMRLMHTGLNQGEGWSKRIAISREMARDIASVPRITDRLRTAFPVRPEFLRPLGSGVLVDTDEVKLLERRIGSLFDALRCQGGYRWEEAHVQGRLLGTADLGHRIQPFALHATSVGGRIALRCVSPVGNVGPDERMDEIKAMSASEEYVIGAILREDTTYDLSLEGEILLASTEEASLARALKLLARICHQADQMERHFLPGTDAPLKQFRPDLEREGIDGR